MFGASSELASVMEFGLYMPSALSLVSVGSHGVAISRSCIFLVLLSRLSSQLMRSILAEQAAKEMVKVFDGIPLLLRYVYMCRVVANKSWQ